MAEQWPDGVEIDAGLEQMRGDGMAQSIDAPLGGNPRRIARRAA